MDLPDQSFYFIPVIPHQKIKLGRNNQILLKSWGISYSYKKKHQLFSLLAQKKQILEGIT